MKTKQITLIKHAQKRILRMIVNKRNKFRVSIMFTSFVTFLMHSKTGGGGRVVQVAMFQIKQRQTLRSKV